MSPSIKSLLSYASSLLLPQIPISNPPGNDVPSSSSSSYYAPLSGAPACPIDGPMSCHNSTAPSDSCCFVYPGGRMLLTQFWDTHTTHGGGEEDWTLHGLWPDLCDGTYDQFCHMTPSYRNVTEILQNYGQEELLGFMNRYWLANYGPNSRLWEHEFNKHGTCINTLAPSCYGEGHKPGQEVVDYFARAAALFKMLDTFYALEKAGITPHGRKHYPLADVQKALEGYSGGKVVLRCIPGGRGSHHNDVLHEAWYVYFVKGSLQTGQFVPAQNLGKEGDAGNCAPWVRYLPKRSRSTTMGEEDL
ncbi:ribonuclease T2 [Diplogelasinospora grovesii]|uniref:ribonuclease T2 n=1 Tax=Diplogelasinospora grovesii TaxID=303347 RepID=A0AAN6N802_9PEZI|nr:ribonuclease T2 [Diplogelasinospora grovesii]